MAAAGLSAGDLLAIVKPKKGKGEAPAFGDAPFDTELLTDATAGDLTSPALRGAQLLLMCGPPGCGKSSIKDELVRSMGIGPHITIDTDAVRTRLNAMGLTFPGLDTQKGLRTMTGVLNAYNARLSDHALREGYSIVFDTTGRNRWAVKALFKAARAHKPRRYATSMAIIYASEDVCAERVAARNADPRSAGRLSLPAEMARSIYRDFDGPQGAARFYILDGPATEGAMHDTLYLYDNNTQSHPPRPELLYHGVDDVAIGPVVPFRGFYGIDIREEPPHLVPAEEPHAGGRRARRRTRSKRRTRKTRRRLRATRRARRTRLTQN